MATIRVTCPSCKGGLQVGEAARGHNVVCPTCKTAFQVAAAPAPPGWFVARNKQKLGPYPASQLKQMAASGQLRPDDMVLREGEGKWTTAGSVKGLFPASTPP